MLVNLFTGIEEISPYCQLEHFLSLNPTLEFELEQLVSTVADNKALLLKEEPVSQSPQASFYYKRLRLYYRYVDNSFAVIKQVQSRMLLKKRDSDSRLNSLYL